jgi:hypothetical protein
MQVPEQRGLGGVQYRRERMRRCLIAAVGAAFLFGCGQRQIKLLEELPEPIVELAPRRPLEPQPSAPQPAVPKPQLRGEGESAWLPPAGISPRWECIVVHHSASDQSSPAAMDQYHRTHNGWDELGYHFVIGNGVAYPDGLVFVGPRWVKQKHGAHCKTPDNFYNDHGIGICLIGDFERSQPTPAQMASLARLCRFLMRQCNIPGDKIYTHGGVTGKTRCPGRYFQLAELTRRLRQPVWAPAQ